MTFVQVDGDTVVLDVWATVSGPRFRIDDFATEPWTASRLDPVLTGEGHPDHRETCPAQQ